MKAKKRRNDMVNERNKEQRKDRRCMNQSEKGTEGRSEGKTK